MKGEGARADGGRQPEMEACIYKDPNQAIEARVKDLLSRMTLKEKAAQMTQVERSVAHLSALRDLALGSVLNGGGSAPMQNATPEDWADMVDSFQKAALSSRLGIPIIYGTDAVHGHNNVSGATIFPHNIGLGATRDAELAKRIGAATALEVRGTGMHWTFAPCIAVSRDPRWGRCYECFSEDTEIVRTMTSSVSGLQGEPPERHPSGYPYVAGRRNIISCAKHFVGDGGTDGGINEGNTISSFDDLDSIHIRPYMDCIAQGVSTIMASYSSWNEIQLHAHRFLLTVILKDKLGFQGFIVSDWLGIDRLSHPHGSNFRECISRSINAGVDMVMVPYRYEEFIEELTSLVESGEIPMSRINDAVERILRVKFAAGIFEHPLSDRSLVDTVGCKLLNTVISASGLLAGPIMDLCKDDADNIGGALQIYSQLTGPLQPYDVDQPGFSFSNQKHRDLAREAVRKSLVLLKNGKDPEKPFLPVDRNARKILVAGNHADDLGFQCGGWTIFWHGNSGRITTGTTVLEAIKESVGKETEVIFEKDPSPSTLAGQDFSYAVVVVGEPAYAEGLGDDAKLEIPVDGSQLIDSIASRIPTLAILISGRPLVVAPELLEKMDAFVAAWLPGSEGAGVTDVVFGDYDFEGLLPRTWFRSVDQLPMNHGDKFYDPLFPFGFGLKMNIKKSTA